MGSRNIVTWSPNRIVMAPQTVLLRDHVVSLHGDLIVLLSSQLTLLWHNTFHFTQAVVLWAHKYCFYAVCTAAMVVVGCGGALQAGGYGFSSNGVIGIFL
jgi:hypothetical protein